MSQRHPSRSVLHVAVVASALVSVGLATATTAQLIRSKRNVHRSAPEVMNTMAPEYEQKQRSAAAAKERGERQESKTKLLLRNLRLGN